MIYIQLLLSMFKIGILSFGGGYVAIPLIQKEIVELNGWITLTEFTDIITIAEMTPGPIAINAATFVGIRIAGIPGALIATFGCALPSCIIVIILAKIYYKYRHLNTMQNILAGLRPAVIAMIASSGVTIALMALFKNGITINYISAGIFIIGIFLLRKYKLNPLYIMFGAGAVGIILYSLFPM